METERGQPGLVVDVQEVRKHFFKQESNLKTSRRGFNLDISRLRSESQGPNPLSLTPQQTAQRWYWSSLLKLFDKREIKKIKEMCL